MNAAGLLSGDAGIVDRLEERLDVQFSFHKFFVYMLSAEWITDYVLFSLGLIAGISFLIYKTHKHITREFDTEDSKSFWKLALGTLGVCIFFGTLVYWKTFPDRWNCPSCEQVNIYLVNESGNQTCRRCEKVFKRPKHFKSSEPFYSLP